MPCKRVKQDKESYTRIPRIPSETGQGPPNAQPLNTPTQDRHCGYLLTPIFSSL